MRRLFARLNREDTIELRRYDSFANALHDSDSYEDPRLIEIVREKTKRYRDNLASGARPPVTSRQMAQNLFVLSYVEPQRSLNVLELGGACGAAYFEARTLLPDRIRHWSITETAAMASAGQTVADDPKLSFHSDIDSAVKQLKSRDLAIAQGVLQYAGDPRAVLKQLFALDFAYVYVTRTAVADSGAPIFTRQETELAAHGPGRLPDAPAGKSSQPMTLVNLDALVSAVPSTYEIVFNFDEGEQRTLSIGGQSVTIRDTGFLACYIHPK